MVQKKKLQDPVHVIVTVAKRNHKERFEKFIFNSFPQNIVTILIPLSTFELSNSFEAHTREKKERRKSS